MLFFTLFHPVFMRVDVDYEQRQHCLSLGLFDISILSEKRVSWKMKVENERVVLGFLPLFTMHNRPRKALLRENSPLQDDARRLPRLGCLSVWLSTLLRSLKANRRVLHRDDRTIACFYLHALQITSFVDRLRCSSLVHRPMKELSNHYDWNSD